jgi:hypothetical protein
MMIDSPAKERIRELIRQGVDWNVLLATARQHRVLPLLYRTVVRTIPNDVPEPVERRLRTAFHANAKWSLLLTSELLQLIDLLRAHAIPSIPYKGSVLASCVYGDLSLRQFGDLDIIVPVKDVARVRALLVSRGYRPEKQMTDEQLVACMRSRKDVTLLRDDVGFRLEIHWGITTERDPIRISPDSLWENLGTSLIAGRSVQTLAPETLLLILCIHGGKHRWERLGWLCDIAEIVRSPGTLDWGRLIENAVRLGGGRILFLGLSLARELLGAEPPRPVLDAIRADSVLEPLSGQVKGWLFSEDPALGVGERERFFVRLREQPADRLRVAVKQVKRHLAPTSRDEEALPLPGFLKWSLYLFRPVRLAGEYGLTPFRRFCKGIFQP